MKKSFFVWIILLFLILPLVKAATINANSCNLADIQNAINSASSGDTIMVPAGNCIWTSTLTITKGIALIGAGVGKTIIDKTTSGDIISYTLQEPLVYSSFRLSGIEFNLNNIASGPYIDNPSPYHEPRIRIDHNYFLNCAGHSWRLQGQVYGVVDNNLFTGNAWQRRYGSNSISWNNIAYSYGGEKNLYVEDNIIVQSKYDGLNQLGLGSILVERYNTINYTNPTSSSNFYPWDSHGNQDWNSNDAAMGREIYGNKIDANNKNVKLFYHRGGMALLFWNKIVNSGSTWITLQEECDDCSYGHTCAICNPKPACSPNEQPQHVSDSYYWNNRFGKTGTSLVVDISLSNSDSDCSVRNYLIAEDVDVFWNKVPFTGSSGVGCGTLANRPSTCNVGVGYWATEQDCSGLDDKNVGANPTEPITGVLYKCGSNNNWIPYYTPFVYPHPIRTDCVSYPLLCDSDLSSPFIDTTSPIRTSGYPTGNLSSGTTSITIGLITNEVATCRYSTAPGVSYSSMTNTFSTTGSTSHSTLITGLQNGNTYNYYVKCIDSSENANINDYLISFSVSPTPKIITLQNMLNAYQEYKRNEVSILYFLDKLKNWIVFW